MNACCVLLILACLSFAVVTSGARQKHVHYTQMHVQPFYGYFRFFRGLAVGLQQSPLELLEMMEWFSLDVG